MKILALDLGDKWVGVAISDALGITCKPYDTVEIEKLELFLEKVLSEEMADTIIVGYPKTSKGTESIQTKKTVELKKKLEKKFDVINNIKIKWLLWDERLSSKRAESLKGYRTKEEKHKSHAVAAAFILQSYLDHIALHKNSYK